MLVLSRKCGETIIIGEGPNKVVLSINRISGDRVTVGIEAKPHIKILRGELERHEPPKGEVA